MHALHRRIRQIPFADKTSKSRYAHQPKRRDRKAAKHHRHLFTQAVHLINMALPCLLHKCPGTEKCVDLHDCMADQMTQRSHQSQGRHHGNSEDHIGQVADCGPGKTSFDMRLLQSHAAAVKNRKHGKSHHHILHPGSLQERGAETVISQPDHRKNPCFYHCHRMQQSCHRCWRHPGVRQPGAHGPDCRLHAEPQKSQQINPEQQILFVADQRRIQDAAHLKFAGYAINNHKDQSDHRKSGAADGIV